MLEGRSQERSGFEISSVQLMTLFVLDETGNLSVKQVSDKLGRSVSAVSRMIDDMVARGWVDRQEDAEDRRAKRIALASAGRTFLEDLESRRIAAQIDLMEELGPEDQRIVASAMRLLAEAAGRRSNVPL
jgi:DNA-binding MarR family transcriptional regulator